MGGSNPALILRMDNQPEIKQAAEPEKPKTGCVLCGDKIKQTEMLCDPCQEWSMKGICCK